MRMPALAALLALAGCGGTPDTPDGSNPGVVEVNPTYVPGGEDDERLSLANPSVGPDAFDEEAPP